MNLQPRKLTRAEADKYDEVLRRAVAGWRIADAEVEDGGEGTLMVPRPSIWRMELPNTSYLAPQAAFWWVSNDKR